MRKRSPRHSHYSLQGIQEELEVKGEPTRFGVFLEHLVTALIGDHHIGTEHVNGNNATCNPDVLRHEKDGTRTLYEVRAAKCGRNLRVTPSQHESYLNWNLAHPEDRVTYAVVRHRVQYKEANTLRDLNNATRNGIDHIMLLPLSIVHAIAEWPKTEEEHSNETATRNPIVSEKTMRNQDRQSDIVIRTSLLSAMPRDLDATIERINQERTRAIDRCERFKEYFETQERAKLYVEGLEYTIEATKKLLISPDRFSLTSYAIRGPKMSRLSYPDILIHEVIDKDYHRWIETLLEEQRQHTQSPPKYADDNELPF